MVGFYEGLRMVLFVFYACLIWSETGISRFYCKYAFGDRFLCFLTSIFTGMSNLYFYLLSVS